MLVTPKGLRVTATIDPGEARGTAIFVATSSVEAALESESLGGSFFTHYLVSGLRGAADSNGDQRVTLAEAQAYASAQTQNATSGWSPATQHPTYAVELAGQRETVLTDLRRADATIVFGADIVGNVVVATRDGGAIVAEVQKAAGAEATLALPSGRYRVFVRGTDAVGVAELSLAWGGHRLLRTSDLSNRSYYEVAQKGATLELFPWRARLGAGLRHSGLTGLGAAVVPRVGLAYSVSPFEVGLTVGWLRHTVTAVDTVVRSDVLHATLNGCYALLGRRADLRFCAVAEMAWWRQRIDRLGRRDALVPSLGVGIGATVPLSTRWFVEPSIQMLGELPRTSSGISSAVRVESGLAFGALF